MSDPIDKAYVSSFALTNLLFLFLVVMTFTPGVNRPAIRFLGGLILLDVLSWGAFDAYWVISGAEEKFHLQVGYYFWASSYALLAWSVFRKKKEPNKALQPTRLIALSLRKAS